MQEHEQSPEFEPIDTQGLDAFGLYMHEVVKIPLLSYEQEYSLAEKVQAAKQASLELAVHHEVTGSLPEHYEELDSVILEGLDAREQMITANLRLVVAIVNRYRVPQDLKLDLIQEGNMGLAQAIEYYDPTYGNKFSTYAFWHIRQKVSRALKNIDLIKLPHTIIDKKRKIFNATESLQADNLEPNDYTIAQYTNLPPEEVRRLRSIANTKTVSLNQLIGESSSEIGDTVPDPSAGVMLDEALGNIWNDIIAPSVDLTDRERIVMEMLCGFNSYDASTLQSVGDYFGITRERVRQIKNVAIGKILKVYNNPEELAALFSDISERS